MTRAAVTILTHASHCLQWALLLWDSWVRACVNISTLGQNAKLFSSVAALKEWFQHASSLSLSPATKSPDLVSLESQFINFFVYSEGKKREVHFYRWPWLEVFDEEVSRVKGSSWFIYVLIKWRHPSYIFFHISLMDVLLEINYTHTHTHSHTETPVAKSRSSSIYYNYFYCSTIPTYHTNNVMSFSDICLDF